MYVPGAWAWALADVRVFRRTGWPNLHRQHCRHMLKQFCDVWEHVQGAHGRYVAKPSHGVANLVIVWQNWLSCGKTISWSSKTVSERYNISLPRMYYTHIPREVPLMLASYDLMLATTSMLG